MMKATGDMQRGEQQAMPIPRQLPYHFQMICEA